MDFSFTEEQEMLRKIARDFLATECPKRVTWVAMQRALYRMKFGLHPTEDLFLRQPSTFTVFSRPAELLGVGSDSD